MKPTNGINCLYADKNKYSHNIVTFVHDEEVCDFSDHFVNCVIGGHKSKTAKLPQNVYSRGEFVFGVFTETFSLQNIHKFKLEFLEEFDLDLYIRNNE